jgi:hypothetical protein
MLSRLWPRLLVAVFIWMVLLIIMWAVGLLR